VSQYGDGDDCPVHKVDARTARKDHTCDACDETIRPGHKYTRTALLFEGAWRVTKRCVRCEAIFQHLTERMKGSSEEWCDGELNCGHDYEERWREPPPEAIAALAFWLPGDPVPT
jgi:hypothetical protein